MIEILIDVSISEKGIFLQINIINEYCENIVLHTMFDIAVS